MQSCALKDKIITIFPTMTFGGDKTHPYSHISRGLLNSRKWLHIIKFLWVDTQYHFIHAKDIAIIIKTILNKTIQHNNIVLGNQKISVKESIQILCKHYKIKQWFSIKIPLKILHLLTKIFKIKLSPWDKHCLHNPNFTHKTVNTQTWGLASHYQTLETILKNT